MRDLFFFFIGSVSIILVFAAYIKWLILYARFRKCTVSDLYSKGIILPFKITDSEKKIKKDDARKLNKTRRLIFTFLLIAFLITILFNVLYEIKN